MDFLEIRKKARERAASGAGERPADPPPAPVPGRGADAAPAPAERPPAREGARGEDAVVTPEDVLEGQLAARLQGLPPAVEEGFTTWRPGSDGPPPVPLEPLDEPGGAREPTAPAPEDFTVVAGLGTAVPVPVHAARRASSEALAGERPRRADAASEADPLAEFFYREDEVGPDVPLGSPAVEPRRDADGAAREEYLTFLLGREEYAVSIERVREVLKAPPVTEVPRAPAHVLGVVTVRGEVVAVCDPRRRLGLPGPLPAPETGRVVVVDAGEGACGLLVDAVASVVRLRAGSVEPCPQGLGGASADCLAGIGRHGERLFTVLDLGALLRRPQAPARRADERERRDRP